MKNYFKEAGLKYYTNLYGDTQKKEHFYTKKRQNSRFFEVIGYKARGTNYFRVAEV